jgi:putative colanic acid biosynthesis glycosyltransferase
MMNNTVLQINCSSNGSTGKIALSIHSYLLSKGFNSYFAYGYGKCEVVNTFQISNWLDIRLHDKLSQLIGLQGYFSILATFRLLSKISDIKPDIIHLHNIHGNYINISMLLLYIKKHNIRVIYTLHDCWAFTGKCPHFVSVKCEKWKNECNNCPQLNTYPRSLFFDNSKKCFNSKKKMITNLNDIMIVTVSEWLESVTKKSFLSPLPIKTIYNGIDTSIFKHTKKNIKEYYNISDKFLILGVASTWEERKGLKDFRELASRLDKDTAIILVGLNKEQLNDLPKNIIGISRTENVNELVELYSAADVFINFSIEETFGLVVAEAMACGTPAIVYNSTASPELVNEGTGFIIEPLDINEVTIAISEIKKNGKVNYSNKCVNRVTNNFDIKLMLKNYLDTYTNILSE